MSSWSVAQGCRVWVNFSLELEDGGEVDTNFGGAPVDFVVGDGSLLPGFEALMYGMVPGERRQFRIPPERAFGQHNENNVQRVERSRFGAETDLQPGLVFSFADAAGGELPGVVKAVEEDTVTVDFNHPLAGHTIVFDVEVHAVEPAE